MQTCVCGVNCIHVSISTAGLPSNNKLYLSVLIKIIRHACFPQPAPEQFFCTPTLCQTIVTSCTNFKHSALDGSRYLTCLLSLTPSLHLCPGNLTCLLSLDSASARSLSPRHTPRSVSGLPFRRHSEGRLYSQT